MREATDGQLAAKAATGDDAAFDELVSRYRTRVYHLALSKVRGRDNALDIAQETFLQAYMSIKTLREPERFAAWLSGITANLCRMHFRKASEVPIPPEMIEELRVSIEPDPNAAMARDALDRLPNGTRSAAILYFIEEMKQTEIAEFLGISLAAVKSRIRDARASLRKEMIHMVKQTAKREEPGDEFEKSLKHRLELARFYREFSELIDAGVNLVRSLFILSESDYSQPIRDATTLVRLAVESGSNLSDALANAPLLQTPESVGLVRAGEYGGNLELTLRSLVRCIDARNLQRDIELYTWCRTLGEILGSGVSITNSLNCAVEFSVSSKLRQATREIIEVIGDSKSLNTVTSRYPDLFPPIARLIMQVGEYYAVLDKALKWFADDLALDMARRLGPAGLIANQTVPAGSFLDTELTREYLSNESPAMRAAAVSLLARIGASDAGIEAAKLLFDGDSEVRKTAVRAIVSLQYRAAVEGLVSLLGDVNESVRRLAASAIAELSLHETAPAIAAMIPMADTRTNHAAISALESMGDIDVLTSRAIELAVSADPHAIGTAIHILIDHPTPAAGDVLTKVLEESNGDFGVAVALGQIGRREAIPTLRRLLTKRRWTWWTNRAAELLGLMGDVDSAPLIRKAVEDGEINRRHLDVADRLEGK